MLNQDDLKVGDLIFTQINFLPFRRVAQDTKTWTNHVGIVADITTEPLIAESTVPVSTLSNLYKFVRRSKNGRLAVRRLPAPLTTEQAIQLRLSITRRLNIMYDTGFNLYSRRQFCSRFVHEILNETVGIKVGKVETLRSLFRDNPDAHIGFWRWWYFLSIPWDRQTITPASIFNDPALETVFDGFYLGRLGFQQVNL